MADAQRTVARNSSVLNRFHYQALDQLSLLKNKLLLKWREPRIGWKFVKKRLSWSDWLRQYLRVVAKWIVLMLVIFAAIRLFRGAVNSIVDLLSLEAVAVGAGFGAFQCFLSWLISIGPVEVQLREDNIMIITAGQTSAIPYKKVQTCTIRKVELDGQKLELLEVQNWDGEVCIVEIDPAMPGDAVMDTLRHRGLQVRRP
jgi:hypothetical protein